MEIRDIINLSINNAKAAIRNAEEFLSTDIDENARDFCYQVIKDNKKFIAEQEWSISLMDD
jgi:hypothetical protein